jgi:hypothetical protein
LNTAAYICVVYFDFRLHDSCQLLALAEIKSQHAAQQGFADLESTWMDSGGGRGLRYIVENTPLV